MRQSPSSRRPRPPRSSATAPWLAPVCLGAAGLAVLVGATSAVALHRTLPLEVSRLAVWYGLAGWLFVAAGLLIAWGLAAKLDVLVNHATARGDSSDF